MAYETSLLPTYDYTAEQEPDLRRGDAIYPEYDGLLIRPYLGPLEADLYEADFGIDNYDPLTAPLAEVAEREYGSQAAYDAAPTLWDRQSEQAHQWATERAAALSGLRRACEYRAQFPTDTDTIQLRIVEPAPSSVDVVLAELRQLEAEIAYETAHPPMFSTAQSLHAKQLHEQTLQLRIPDTQHPSSTELDQDSHLPISPESELTDESTFVKDRARRKLGPVGREPSALWRIASLSARGAKQLLGRLKRQVSF